MDALFRSALVLKGCNFFAPLALIQYLIFMHIMILFFFLFVFHLIKEHDIYVWFCTSKKSVSAILKSLISINSTFFGFFFPGPTSNSILPLIHFCNLLLFTGYYKVCQCFLTVLWISQFDAKKKGTIIVNWWSNLLQRYRSPAGQAADVSVYQFYIISFLQYLQHCLLKGLKTILILKTKYV